MYLLACRSYDLENQTAPNVRKFVDSILLGFDLKLHSRSCVVSDNENKMKAASNDVVRVDCSDHYLSKIWEHAFTTTTSNTGEVQNLFEVTKGLVPKGETAHSVNPGMQRSAMECNGVQWIAPDCDGVHRIAMECAT
jgi:hypothetical protein